MFRPVWQTTVEVSDVKKSNVSFKYCKRKGRLNIITTRGGGDKK